VRKQGNTARPQVRKYHTSAFPWGLIKTETTTHGWPGRWPTMGFVTQSLGGVGYSSIFDFSPTRFFKTGIYFSKSEVLAWF
jgi:hypothetical protein